MQGMSDEYHDMTLFILLTIIRTQISLQGYFHSRLACGPYHLAPLQQLLGVLAGNPSDEIRHTCAN